MVVSFHVSWDVLVFVWVLVLGDCSDRPTKDAAQNRRARMARFIGMGKGFYMIKF
jgi:hypothetical protein